MSEILLSSMINRMFHDIQPNQTRCCINYKILYRILPVSFRAWYLTSSTPSANGMTSELKAVVKALRVRCCRQLIKTATCCRFRTSSCSAGVATDQQSPTTTPNARLASVHHLFTESLSAESVCSDSSCSGWIGLP